MNIMRLYDQSPVFIQNIACTVQGRRILHDRYGAYFQSRMRDYQKTGQYPYEQICEYQKGELKKLLIHCYETVPYYKREFDEYGFNPYFFLHLDELSKLPIITKDILKANEEDFISTAKLPSKTVVHMTGGTTGKSLAYHTTLNEIAEQWVVWWRYRNRLGIRFGDWCGEFCSKQIVPLASHKPPYYRVDNAEHRVFFSPYHLNEQTVFDYAQGLKTVKWVHGYTQKLTDMAYWLNEKNIKVSMDFVTIGAENLYDTQKNLLEEVFGSRVYQHYGLTEGVANFSEDKDGTMRVDEDYCFTEFIGDGEKKSIVGTNLHNYRMPLIRYRTGDYAELDSVQDGGFRIVKSMQGRESEYITTKIGTKITGVEFDEEVFGKISHIAEAQVVQKARDVLEIRVIRLNGYHQEDEDMLLQRLTNIVGRNMQYQITYPMSLDKEKNGKFKLILNEMGGYS